MATRNLRDGVLSVYDKGRAHHMTVSLDSGDLSWTETQNVLEISDRGVLDHVRSGDEAPMDISFSVKYQGLYTVGGAAGVTPYEAIKGVSGAAAYVNTLATDVHCSSLQFQVLDTSDDVEETVIFRDFYYSSIEFAEGDEYNTLSVTGRSFRTAPVIS